MDVPLWAFLTASIAGPIIGAGLTVLGTMLNNRHQTKEAEATRRFQLRSSVSTWRMEQRYALYSEVLEYASDLYGLISLAERQNDTSQLTPEKYYAQEAQYRLLSARLRLQAPEDLCQRFVEFGRGSAKMLSALMTAEAGADLEQILDNQP